MESQPIHFLKRNERNSRGGLRSLPPNSDVYSCDYIEMGSCFALDGVRTCVHGTINGPLLASSTEINGGELTHEKVVARRTQILEIVNGITAGEQLPCTTCANLKKKRLAEVDLNHLGGKKLPAGMNIQHYSACNQRCTYCAFTVQDLWLKPQYDPIEYFEVFRSADKLRGNNWIDFSGGETSLLQDFDRVFGYLHQNELGKVVIYTNATFFKQSIYDALKNENTILTVSLDTGLPSTYRKIRGSKDFDRVITNLLKYRESGTENLWLKYIVTAENQTDDDLWSFVFAMMALKPNRVMICPDFPYGKTELDGNTVKFCAKLWCLLDIFVKVRLVDYTKDFGDPVWVKYHQDLPIEIEAQRQALAKRGLIAEFPSLPSQ